MKPSALSLIIPTQNGLRHTRTALKIAAEGWKPRPGDPPVLLVTLSDAPGTGVFVHDGHHRIVGALLGGHEIPDCDVVTKIYSLRDYLDVNPTIGWVTPFDPITECRKADFGTYREEARAYTGPDLLAYTLSRKDEYAEPRKIPTMGDLAAAVQGSPIQDVHVAPELSCRGP